MSLIHKIATLEMFRVAEQHQHSTEASHRRTATMMFEHTNDITDDYIELCEKHAALEKREERAFRMLISVLNGLWAYSSVMDTLYPSPDQTPQGSLSREDIRKMVADHAAALDKDLECEKRTRERIEARLSAPKGHKQPF